MSTETPRRRLPSARLAAVGLAVIAAIVVAVVLISGGGGLEKTDTIQVGASPAAIAIGSGSVWVANSDGGTLVRVDPDSKKVEGRPAQRR